MVWETLKEQRRAKRRPVGQIATIRAKPDAQPQYCIVLNESGGGVRISIPRDFELLDRFILRRYAGTETWYKVVWRDGRLIRAERVSELPDAR